MHGVILIVFLLLCQPAYSQSIFVNAHAHNDYEHSRPLFDALMQGFVSVEADVYLIDGQLLVSHNRPKANAMTLQQLYLNPLDSIIKSNGGNVNPDYSGTFYLMIDFKTEAVSTYRALLQTLSNYPALRCSGAQCPVKIFISGNRPLKTITEEGYRGVSLDGRPDDLGKGFTAELMPIVSDNYYNWSAWRGKSEPVAGELDRIRELADRVHAEGKKLRLWAHPDNELVWTALLDADVDLINTDRLVELSRFLKQR